MAPSNAIPIPRRTPRHKERASSFSVASSTVSDAREIAGSYDSYGSVASSQASPSSSPLSEARRGDKSKVRRRESLMSANFARAEHAVINIGDEDSVRLITCVKASQGFDWNLDIFLPSDYHVDSDLERRPDPVEEIVLTDEEVAKMFPS